MLVNQRARGVAGVRFPASAIALAKIVAASPDAVLAHE
jgi:hypothetical protein